MLKTKNISYSIGTKKILNNVSADFLPGKINMILGPNGSGKSSFLKIFSGEIKNFEGEVFYNNNQLHSFKSIELAKLRAVMSQQPELSFPLAVQEVVMMGRYPHFSFSPNKKDIFICNEVMELLQLSGFKERNYLTLSGGEKQRVQFARLLAQVWEVPATGTRYIFLDEPLNNLDIKYQQEFLQILKKTILTNTVLIVIIHDINLALQYGDNILFLKNGQVIAAGEPSSIISTQLIQEVFEVSVSIIRNADFNTPTVVFNNPGS